MKVEKKLLILFLFLGIFLANREIVMAKENEILLPIPIKKGDMSLEETISKRRSQRGFASLDLNWAQIGQLLWSAQGITQNRGSLRAAPSAGALYPIEIYLVGRQGLFHYIPQGHKLEVIARADLRGSLAAACLGQGSVKEAAIDIVICAVYHRITGKYGERGIRYAHIEAGHIAENIHLQSVSLGLGSVPIGAFSDEEVKKVLSLPPEQEPLYIIPVGYPE